MKHMCAHWVVFECRDGRSVKLCRATRPGHGKKASGTENGQPGMEGEAMAHEVAVRVEELPAQVLQYTREIKVLVSCSAQDLVAIGEKLAAVKDLLPHGEWLLWLKHEFDW